MSAHTPGPWGASEQPGGQTRTFKRKHWQIGSNSTYQGVAYAFSPHDSDSDANARLIAAAPDLLDVVKRGRQKLATYVSVFEGDKELKGLLIAWDSAIAKAEAPRL